MSLEERKRARIEQTDYAESQGKEREAEIREKTLRSTKAIPVNQIFAYNRETSFLQLHMLPNRTTSTGEKIRLIREGLSIIAERVQRDPSIQEVRASSWIITDHPKFLQRLGFTNVATTEEATAMYKRNGIVEPPGHAIISREELLRRYYKENREDKKAA